MFADVRAILLDRDGVLNAESDAFIKTADEWIPLPGAMEAVAMLSSLPVHIGICSNQSGVARQMISGAQLSSIHRKLMNTVGGVGGRIDTIRYCPHGPNDQCRCRKPKAGMILDLCRVFNIHPNNAVVVGDAERDLRSALEAGARAVLVKTGRGSETEPIALGLQIPIFNDLQSFATEFSRQHSEHER